MDPMAGKRVERLFLLLVVERRREGTGERVDRSRLPARQALHCRLFSRALLDKLVLLANACGVGERNAR